MKRNLSLSRAASALCHPVTIGAILLLLVNDHVFKEMWPSWWTGKLSDLAWVVFTPPLLALVLSLLVPPRLLNQEKKVAWIAFSAVGIAYALFNLNEAFHAAVLRLIEITIGPSAMVRDLTDAITLVGLLIGWKVYWRPVSSFEPRALAIASLASLATIATSGPPLDNGISCLEQQGNTLVAMASYSPDEYQGEKRGGFHTKFISQDGGITWTEEETISVQRCSYYADQEWEFSDVRNPRATLKFRVIQGKALERWDPDKSKWEKEFDFSSLTVNLE